jgi:hypothetical protein
MALTFSAAKANVKRHFYVVYMRETTTAIVAANYNKLSNWKTFLNGFNAIVKCENENVKIDEVPNTVAIDFGEERIPSYNGVIEIKYIQGKVADMEDLDDLRTKDADLLLVDSINAIFFYVHNKRFLVEKHLTSGQIPEFSIKCETDAAETSGTYGTIHTYGTIPAA